MEHMEMKISQPIFGILVALTKNEVRKIFNEPHLNSWQHSFINYLGKAGVEAGVKAGAEPGVK